MSQQNIQLISALIDTMNRAIPTASDRAPKDIATRDTQLSLMKMDADQKRHDISTQLAYDTLENQRDMAEADNRFQLKLQNITNEDAKLRLVLQHKNEMKAKDREHAHTLLESDYANFGKIVGKVTEDNKYVRFPMFEPAPQSLLANFGKTEAYAALKDKLEADQSLTPIQKARQILRSLPTTVKTEAWSGVPFKKTDDGELRPLTLTEDRENREREFVTAERMASQEFESIERKKDRDFDREKFNKTFSEEQRQFNKEYARKNLLTQAEVAEIALQVRKGELDLNRIKYKTVAELALSGIPVDDIPKEWQDAVKAIRASDSFILGKLQKQHELKQVENALLANDLPTPDTFIDSQVGDVFYNETRGVTEMEAYYNTNFNEPSMQKLLKIASVDPTSPKVAMYRNQLLSLERQLEDSGEFTGLIDELTPQGQRAKSLLARIKASKGLIDASNKRLIGSVKK